MFPSLDFDPHSQGGMAYVNIVPQMWLAKKTAKLGKSKHGNTKLFPVIGVNSVLEDKTAQVFLTSQSKVTYKLLCNLASQQSPPKDINELTIDEITDFMKNQFDPARYIVRERFKFWSKIMRKPGETIEELAARIRQDTVTCDFSSPKTLLMKQCTHASCARSIKKPFSRLSSR